MSLRIHPVSIPPEEGFPFHIVANRYTPWVSAINQRRNKHHVLPTTLLLLHSTSFHKEIFMPILDTLFSLADHGGLNIREAWAIDCPNHGESAVLNTDILQTKPYDEYFSCARYAEAVHRFLRAKGTSGEPYVTMSDRIVAIGHSLGGCAAIFLSERVRLASLILIDPFLYPGPPDELSKLRAHLVRQAHVRRDVWHTREDARASLRGTAAKGWDDRILDLYVRYGVRTHPHANRQLAPFHGVTLACTREQEATMYRDADGGTKPLQQLTAVCHTIPVHIAFGADSDVIPRVVQERVVDACQFASIAWIKGAGHLVSDTPILFSIEHFIEGGHLQVPQQAPEEVAHFIYDALSNNNRHSARL